MPRTISLNFRKALYAQETSDFPIVLITLSHPEYSGVFRISTDNTVRYSDTPLVYGTYSNGVFYQYLDTVVTLPDDIEERPPTAQITFENVSGILIPLVRNVVTPGNCVISVVSGSDPDTVELSYPSFDIRSVQYNASVLTIEVGLDSLENEPFPAGLFVPSWFPGLF